MKDYIEEARCAVLEYEEGKTGMTTAGLLAPWNGENLLKLLIEADQLIFVGRLYNLVRRLEAAAHKFQDHPKSIHEQIVDFFVKVSRGGKKSAEEEAIAHIRIVVEQKGRVVLAVNAMEEKVKSSSIRDLRLDGLEVPKSLEQRYSDLLELAEFSRESLLEKLVGAKRVLTESLPAWGY